MQNRAWQDAQSNISADRERSNEEIGVRYVIAINSMAPLILGYLIAVDISNVGLDQLAGKVLVAHNEEKAFVIGD